MIRDLEIVHFKAGEFLFKEGDPGFHFFIIQVGQVEVFRLGEDKNEIPLGIVGEGQALGEFARVDNKPRSATARAMDDVEAVRVSEEAYDKLLKELPHWAVSLIENLVDRVRQTNEIIRRHGIVDKNLMLALEKVDFDPNSTKS